MINKFYKHIFRELPEKKRVKRQLRKIRETQSTKSKKYSASILITESKKEVERNLFLFLLK